MLQKLENERRRNLVRRISDTDIKEGEVNFDGITTDELEFMLVAHDVNTFGDLGDHTRVYLDSNDLLASLHQRCCQVTCTWTDFQYHVCCFNSRFLNNLLDDKRVLENMLTK